jgi:hypothetical protein
MASLDFYGSRQNKVRMKPQYNISNANKVIINRLLLLAKQKQFPKKDFLIGGIKKQYCSYLHFTESPFEI